MLDPDLVLAAVVSTIQLIPEVVTAVAGSSNIVGHSYTFGEDNSIGRAIYQMSGPSLLVAYTDMIGGQFNASSVWKHRLEIWIRPKNAASGNNPPAATPQHLYWLIMNKPVTGAPGNNNIRNIRILPDLLPVDAMPSLTHHQDENGADLFSISLVLSEWGDSPT